MRDKLRAIKVNPEDDRVPTMTEIALVPQRDIPGIAAAGHIPAEVVPLSASLKTVLGIRDKLVRIRIQIR
jgi:hypothetical protein